MQFNWILRNEMGIFSRPLPEIFNNDKIATRIRIELTSYLL